MAQRKDETREEYLAKLREYYQRKRERGGEQMRLAHNAKMLAYYYTHFEAISIRRKELHQLHYEEDLAKKRIYALAWRQKVRYEALMAYGDCRCACCGETTLEFLGIDHINGGGSKHFDFRYGGKKRLGGVALYRWLKDHNYPLGYQVLCHNCNFAKGHYGICPHQKT